MSYSLAVKVTTYDETKLQEVFEHLGIRVLRVDTFTGQIYGLAECTEGDATPGSDEPGAGTDLDATDGEPSDEDTSDGSEEDTTDSTSSSTTTTTTITGTGTTTPTTTADTGTTTTSTTTTTTTSTTMPPTTTTVPPVAFSGGSVQGSISPGAAAVGQTIQMSACGFQPGEMIEWSFLGLIASGSANDEGCLQLSLQIPAQTPGGGHPMEIGGDQGSNAMLDYTIL